MFRTTATKFLSTKIVSNRSLHSSPINHKTVAEKVSEAADKLNKNLGQGLASVIGKGEEVTDKAKAKLDDMKGTTQDLGGDLRKKGRESMGDLSKKGEEVKEKSRKVESEIRK